MRNEWSTKWTTKRKRTKLGQSSLRIIMGDKKMSNLQLATTGNFNGVTCEFYGSNTTGYPELWLSRKQIGEALEYSDPQKALDNIHSKHKDRLDMYSVPLDLRATDGKTYPTLVYNRRGIMEICRWSRQPKANEFMDWVWNLVEAYQDGKLKAVQSPKTPITPLDREELAAYMMCNAQMIDSYKASTDAVLSRQTECLNTMVGVLKNFTEIESQKTGTYGAMLENNLNALKLTADTIEQTMKNIPSLISSVSIGNRSPQTENTTWKEESMKRVYEVVNNTKQDKKIILRRIYDKMKKNGVSIDNEISAYMRRHNIRNVNQVFVINVIAENNYLCAKFDDAFNELFKPYNNKEETRSVLVEKSRLDYTSMPENISLMAKKMIPKHGKTLARVMINVYKNFETETGINTKDYLKGYGVKTGRHTANKAWVICQDPKLEKSLIGVMTKMAEG